MPLPDLQPTRHDLLPIQLLDRLIVLWVMPPLGFLMTVLQTPALRYLTANHVLIAVLIGAIAFNWQQRALSQRTVLYLLIATLLTAFFLGIEWLHFLAGRRTIDNLADLRMIVYSPFYGGIMIFVLYAIYLTTLSDGLGKQHLRFFVRLMSWFHIVFLGYWLLLYCGWIEMIPKADLLHSNSIAYGALFVLCVMLFYRPSLGLRTGTFKVFLVVNIAAILVNQTRGAIIALAAIALYFVMAASGGHRRAVLMKLTLGAILGIVVVVALGDGTLQVQILGKDVDALGIVLDRVSDAYERKVPDIYVSPDTMRDESSLSATSRIGSNYYSLLSFVDNPILGIGQASSYSISVIGSGVHSLHFLMASATGILGMALFASVLFAIALSQGVPAISRRFVVMLVVFFGYVLMFINSMPTFFALIVTVLAYQQRQTNFARPNYLPDQHEFSSDGEMSVGR